MATSNPPSPDLFAARLGDPAIDAKLKFQIASELKDQLDIMHNHDYPKALQKLIPVFIGILQGPVSFISSSNEHKLRNCVLDIIHRLPLSPPEALEKYALELMNVLMNLVRVENEENAVLCMKTIMDFQRSFKKTLADQVQPFLNLIQEMFGKMPQAVKDTFDNVGGLGMPSTPGSSFQSPKPMSPMLGQDLSDSPSKPLVKGTQSFKVLAECPIIVVSLFQENRLVVHSNVKVFVPLIKEMLSLQAGPQAEAHKLAASRGTIMTGVCPGIKNRAAFGDFITAQVKTMSFLAYVLRVYAQQLQDFLPLLPDIVVRLLKDCPREKSSARKELLVATRHIINFNHRRIFVDKIDELLNERILIGDGLTVYETMRPLAYSMLADLIHHVRDMLGKEQIRRTVVVYTRNLHDSFPGTSFQTMSAKLLLNLADCIAKLPDKQEARHFLVMILDAIAEKFAAMNRQFPNAVKQSKLTAASQNAEIMDVDDSNSTDYNEIDIFSASPIKLSNTRERGSDPVTDNKFLFKNLMNGLKNMLHALRTCNPEVPPNDNNPSNWNEVAFGFDAENVKIITKLFREGARVFRYYGTEDKSPATVSYSNPLDFMQNILVPSLKEEKDLLEIFATVFHCIDPATFHEVFHSEIPHLYEMMFEHMSLLHVPQFFLASEATSPSFCGMLLQFLMERIEEVGTSDVKRSSILLRLFKLSFMAVTLFSSQNEQVLLPHVSKIVTKSIQLSTIAEQPINYFYLLRSLFRSIGGGRFEVLYKEILPLLEVLLEVLNTQILSARKTSERDLYVELCLTVPARLSNLLPHLSYLMKPLVVALKAGTELVSQGLRTLELCVDNLTADYLDPIMAPVIEDLMSALYDHLKPLPYNHIQSHTTMRILGKLGGRNRRFLTSPPSVEYRPYADDECSVNVAFYGAPGERPYPLTVATDLALQTLMSEKSEMYHKRQSLRLITSNVKLFIGTDQLPDDFVQLVRVLANDLAADTIETSNAPEVSNDRNKPVHKKHDQEDVLRRLLKACLHAVSIPELEEEASDIIYDVCRHFTVLDLGTAVATQRYSKLPFSVEGGEEPMNLDSHVIADAISDCLASESHLVREAAENAIKTIYDSAVVIFGGSEHVGKLPIFGVLSKRFCHNCYQEEWFAKAGGCLGIKALLKTIDLGEAFMVDRQIDWIRSLFYVIKDMPLDLPATTRNQASEALELVLRTCNKSAKREDAELKGSKMFNLCAHIVYELSNCNKYVREAAQRSFTILSEILGMEIHEMMTPVKERLLNPIFGKPLRALPFASQIGYIDAITFCLQLQNGFLEINDEMTRLLLEALALADADDEALNTHKGSEYRTTESVISLRVVCIRLLSMAIAYPEFNTTAQTQAKGRIISVFFKSLYAKSPEVVEAANDGLRGVLTHTHKLPKALLQNGLRPILMNLSDHKRLSVEGLEGLARLLELLTNYFKVEIGARLFDHLKQFAEPSFMQEISFKLLEQNQNIRIIASILNIFHLLPPTANQFLETMVDTVMRLEESLRRTNYSPFRLPLLKFVNRYPSDTWDNMAQKLKDVKYGRLFAQLLEHEMSGPLREVVVTNVPKLIQCSLDLDTGEEQRCIAVVNAIQVIHAISEHESKWLVDQRELLGRLLEVGGEIYRKACDGTLPTYLCLSVEQACTSLISVFMMYLSCSENDLDFLFQVIEATNAGTLRSSHILEHHIYTKIICSPSVEYWRSVIFKCLDLYNTKNSSQVLKTYAFKNLVNPILIMDVQRGCPTTNDTKLVDTSLVSAVHQKIWKANLGDLDDGQNGLDHSRMEVLQMSALLIHHHHHLIAESRKDVIKFGWNFIKLEDIINKQAAYVLISYFIRHFETPSKIVTQIYVALLKAHQPEGKALVKQALDLIAPVLPRRMPSGPEAKGFPLWAKWPRRILSEESHNQPQLVNIFQFLVRQGKTMFYDSREHFYLGMVTALHKLVFSLPNPSTENKTLSIDLVQLIWDWEVQESASQDKDVIMTGSPLAREKKLSITQSGNDASSESNSVPSIDRQSAFPLQYRQQVLRHLIQFISTTTEKYEANELCKRSLKLLQDFLEPDHWADVDIDMYQKVLENQLITSNLDAKTIPQYVNSLQVLRVIVESKPDEWILGNDKAGKSRITSLMKLLEKSLRCDNVEIQDALQRILARILEVIPKDPEGEEEEQDTELPGSQFLAALSQIVSENIATSLILSINILWTLSQKRPEAVDVHIAALMRAFQKLARDHLAGTTPPAPPTPAAAPGATGPDGAAVPPPAPMDAETSLKLLSNVIDVASIRVSSLGDQRRPFLSVLAQLVEKSMNNDLCLKILGVVRNWVFTSTETFPTLKEKTAVLSKMLSFESRPDNTLCNKFLELIIQIYEDPKITRTELTVRLEHAFLIGTRAQDVDMRERFLTIFTKSVSRTLNVRFSFLLGTQNWEYLDDSYWLNQVTELLIGCIEIDRQVELHKEDFRVASASSIFGSYPVDRRKDSIMLDDQFEEFMGRHQRFCNSLSEVTAADVFEPIGQLQHLDADISHDVWIRLFPLCWAAIGTEDRQDLSRSMISLLSKESLHRQMDKRPNVIQSLLGGIERSMPRINLPSHLIKYISKSFNAWYSALHILEDAANYPPTESSAVRESNLDALAEVYAGIQEEDMFYGLWRRRCQYLETNAALSYEQNGLWDKAQHAYENAQIKARTGVLPFSQAEYMLWEDHWIICAQKLQQWEILSDFAKHENYNDLLLECAWRLLDNWGGPSSEGVDSTIKSLMDSPTPRRYFFLAFMALQKVHSKNEQPHEFQRICDEAIQLSLRKWHGLPKKITNAHIPLLQAFQQIVELHDASVIYASLSTTTAQNLDAKSQELKLLLGTWRDRLPNVWDDINSWHDLVTWRQHVFTSINNTYLPLIPPANGGNNSNSYAYRGYHETAWIINRFAHVARKHQLPDVCINQLSKIYTLPNIEIQEAFLKLREQAKCHYQNPNELNNGLEVINNTNLSYFGAQQKAEFYTLKGMFQAKLSKKEEANEAFGTALFYDLKLPKAWAEWGIYNDQVFKENPTDLSPAGNAVSCYLEAAGLFKNGKARRLLSRILWLLSLDDAAGTISQAFEAYKGETPVWYWITFIPQLLSSLGHKEAELVRGLLVKIAKNFPQALYFLLRTSKEDFAVIKKQTTQNQNKGKQGSPSAPTPSRPDSSAGPASSPQAATNGQAPSLPTPGVNGQSTSSPARTPKPIEKRAPWEYTDEIMSVLKTAFPLLALSMETMGDQIHKYFKCPPDEDAYRLIVALLNDGLQYVGRIPPFAAEDVKLPPATETNITRFAETILPAHIRVAFESEFVQEKPNLQSYIQKLRRWRDRFEEKLDRRSPHASLETYSPHLSEFRFQKFDEVEVPGQYLLHKDNNKDFIRIERFLPQVDIIRGYGICHRRLKLRGHDGSVHPFAVQHPAQRHCRREERIAQLFRIFNGVLSRRKESRRRNLGFHLPVMVPLAPHIRIVEDDASYISLQGIYEDFCRRTGMSKDEPLVFAMKSLRSNLNKNMNGQEVQNLKMEVFNTIQEKMVPSTVAVDFLQSSYKSFTEFWLFRRQFSYQFAALTFMTYVMNMNNRYPHKMFIARSTGNIWGTELIPAMAANNAYFHNNEPVPFRLTPNIHSLMGPIGVEGVFSCAVMAIARCLTGPEFDLEQHLSLFVRDEMIFWFTQQHRSGMGEQKIREKVDLNSEIIVRRAASLCSANTSNIPANQTVIDLISKAVNPANLAATDHLWMPYL